MPSHAPLAFGLSTGDLPEDHIADQQAAAAASQSGGLDGASSPLRWPVFLASLGAVLFIEHLMLRDLPAISVRHAWWWFAGFLGYCVALGLVLGLAEGWTTPSSYASFMLLNMALSPDNLVVFMMFLTHAQLPVRHHRFVICNGFLVAVALRLATMLGTAKLIESFSQLQVRRRHSKQCGPAPLPWYLQRIGLR